jgi:flagellar P-ring protein FlgI
MFRRLILSLAAALAFVAAPAQADRIKDLGGFQGIRSNQLTGLRRGGWAAGHR